MFNKDNLMTFILDDCSPNYWEAFTDLFAEDYGLLYIEQNIDIFFELFETDKLFTRLFESYIMGIRAFLDDFCNYHTPYLLQCALDDINKMKYYESNYLKQDKKIAELFAHIDHFID